MKTTTHGSSSPREQVPARGTRSLSVAMCGNIGNSHYAVARALRAHGLDAHMFVGAHDPRSWRPETDDDALLDGYPSWIHEGRWYRPADVPTPWRAPLVAALRDFDVVIASGSTPAFVQFAGRPWCFLATGGDITVRPFPWTFRHRRGDVLQQLGHGVLSAWQRRALRRADQIWTQPFAPLLDAIDRLGIAPERISSSYFPLIVDTDVFRPRPEAAASTPWGRQAREDADFVVFSPTRLVFGDSPEMRRSGQWKGSQTLLDAFAELVRRDVVPSPVLALPDWVMSDDVALAKRRVVDMGIADHVRFIQPPRPEGFSRHELVDLYSIADVVVDQFGSGAFGLVSLEGMSCANPVVGRVDLPAARQMYDGDIVWLAADDAAAAADHFTALALDPDRAAALGGEARAWIERHHTPEVAAGRYVAGLTRAIDELGSA